MCSIIGSFSTEKVKELAQLNAYRGQHSHSICYIHRYTYSITKLTRSLGELPLDEIDIPEDHYCIVHQQAPTTDNKSLESVHPAQIDKDYLWHNGIIKDSCVKQLRKELGSYSSWDTYLMLEQLRNSGTPDNIDGTFSCVWVVERFGIKLFRNEIAPLFYDNDYNISSTKFAKSVQLQPNTMYVLDTSIPETLKEQSSFNTMENPYYFG